MKSDYRHIASEIIEVVDNDRDEEIDDEELGGDNKSTKVDERE